MALLTKTYTLDADMEPHIDPELGLRLARGPVNDRTRLLLHPHGNDEPRYRRFVVGFLNLFVDTVTGLEKVEGQGQIVLTGRRVLGLVTDGTHNAATLSEAAGTVTGFSFNRSDILDAQIPTNWRGIPKQVILAMSNTDSAPYDIALAIDVVAAAIVNGKAMPTTTKAFVEVLGDEAVQELL